ncbi:MAG: hypothetical protein J0G32_08390 [Alphaproteobacteria bacterium]|nr:hypothetical protein [Alphaproteobacteria bacterium]OJV15126.1 MAG: hypothetical protein BGO27_06785 [Alphaproteobacteria bacterium 33-17]
MYVNFFTYYVHNANYTRDEVYDIIANTSVLNRYGYTNFFQSSHSKLQNGLGYSSKLTPWGFIFEKVLNTAGVATCYTYWRI